MKAPTLCSTVVEMVLKAGNVCVQHNRLNNPDASWKAASGVVRMLDFDSICTGFESHSEHFIDLFHGSPKFSNPSAVLVNSQLVGFPPVPVGILD